MGSNKMSRTELNPILQEFQAEDAELAAQLLSLRQEPGSMLRRRIQSIPRQKARQTRLLPRLVWGSVAAIIVILLVASPGAQAMWVQVEKVIGRIHLTIMEVLPNRSTPIVIESTPISLAEAQAVVPFDFAVPTYLPDALNRDAEVFVTQLEPPIVKMRWWDTGNGFVQLAIHPANGKNNLTRNLIGSESSDIILINGQEGVIIYGGWDETSRTWSHQDRVTTLIWELDGIQYNLLSFSNAVPLTELIIMAESVR
jgi:hypothetical protein